MQKETENLSGDLTMKLLLIIILSLILAPKFNAQTIDLDSRKVHIGDSFESVKKQFDLKLYKWTTDSSNSNNWSYLYKYNNPKKGGSEPIAQLDFSANSKDLIELRNRTYKYYLHTVHKYWDNGTDQTRGNNELAQKIFSIIQNNGIDKYSFDISTTKYADAKSIALKIRPNVKLKLEFNGNNNCILSEVISKQEDTLSASYVLLYPDPQNFIGKDKMIYNMFSSEKEADAKKGEYDMEYFMKNYLPPHSQIIRFLNEPLTKMPTLQ
jgi:hypothetical protein